MGQIFQTPSIVLELALGWDKIRNKNHMDLVDIKINNQTRKITA